MKQTDKEKILAEIERRKNIVNNAALQIKNVEKRNHYLGIVEEYDDILRFINSFPEEPVSEDMWEESKQYALRQVLASTDTEMSEQAYLDLRLFSGFELAVAHKDGAEWKEKQMVNRAIWCEAHPRDGEIWGSFEHLNLHECEKVRVIIIKEE